jgi:hypothetical protein
MDFTILIGTCDKYSYLWNNFLKLFNKYWDDDIIVDKYFNSETLICKDNKFKTFTPGKIPYSDCVKYGLNNITTPYVLWLQDDYFFRRKISKQTFKKYFEYIEKYNIDRLGICNMSKYYTTQKIEDNLYKFKQNSQYTISLQPSIWKTEFFKSCLPNGKKENPWQFEVDGSRRLNKKPHNIYFIKQDSPWYLEAVHKGSFTTDYHKIIKQEKLKHNGKINKT